MKTTKNKFYLFPFVVLILLIVLKSEAITLEDLRARNFNEVNENFDLEKAQENAKYIEEKSKKWPKGTLRHKEEGGTEFFLNTYCISDTGEHFYYPDPRVQNCLNHNLHDEPKEEQSLRMIGAGFKFFSF